MKRLLALVGFAALLWWGLVQWRASGSTGWTSLGDDLEMRIVRVPSGVNRVSIVAFRAPAEHLHVVTGDYLVAAAWRKKFGARVAVNGGFFDEADHSLGLRVARGKKVSPLRDADWGVFYIRRGRAYLRHTRDFTPATRVDEAVQCGPRLVVNGRVTKLKPQYNRRTGLGIDRSGRVVVAVADGNLSLDTWAHQWEAADGLNCRDALNLDGGPSTQLSLQTPTRSASIEGGWSTPDAIVIE